jgi:hypothetical protein
MNFVAEVMNEFIHFLGVLGAFAVKKGDHREGAKSAKGTVDE